MPGDQPVEQARAEVVAKPLPKDLLKTEQPLFKRGELPPAVTSEQGIFMSRATEAVRKVEEANGIQFSFWEKQYLDRLAQGCFIVGGMITQQDGGNRDVMGRFAFAYALTEALATHKYKQRHGLEVNAIYPPTQEEFQEFHGVFADESEDSPLKAANEGIKELIGGDDLLTPVPGETEDEKYQLIVHNIHRIHNGVISQNPRERVPLSEVSRLDPFLPLIVPLYIMAKNFAQEAENFDVTQQASGGRLPFSLEELREISTNVVYAERPTDSQDPEDKFYRRYWSRMVVLCRDFYFRSFRGNAFAFANFAVGEATSEPNYFTRYQNSASLGLSSFFPGNTEILRYQYYTESTAKSNWGALENALQDEGPEASTVQGEGQTVPPLSQALVALAQKYGYETSGMGNFENLNDPLYLVKASEQISIVDFLVQKYYALAGSGQEGEIGAFLDRVRKKINATPDMQRLRVNFTEMGDLDEFCRTVVMPADSEAYIRFDATDIGEDEPTVIKLSELPGGTMPIEGALARFFLKHPPDERHRVFAAVYSERKGPNGVTREVQMIPAGMAPFLWHSRTQWKLENDGTYKENQNL